MKRKLSINIVNTREIQK